MCFVTAAGRMCVCAATDGDILGDRGDSSVHDCHAPRHPFPYVWHHEFLWREYISLLAEQFILLQLNAAIMAMSETPIKL